MALLETDNCWPGNGWEGEGSESPPGWRYFSGTGQGALGPRRPMPVGTVYAEFDGHWDQTGGDYWICVGLACINSGAIWDASGYTVRMLVADGALQIASNQGTFVLGSNESVKIGMHHAPDFAFTIGVGFVDNDMFVYYGGQLVYHLTGNTAPKGNYALASAYNYAGGHYNEVRFYDALPVVVAPVPLPALLEVDDCWPGRGWVDGSENPAGWRYYAGTGQGDLGSRRPVPEGTVYAEWKFYWDATGGDNWLRMGIWVPAVANWSPGGYSIMVDTDNGQLHLPPSWYPNATYLVGSEGSVILGARRTPGTAARVGIGIIGGDIALYVNGEMVYRITGATVSLGPWAVASAYNFGNGHYDEVSFYSEVPAAPIFGSVVSTVGVTSSVQPAYQRAINSSVAVTTSIGITRLVIVISQVSVTTTAYVFVYAPPVLSQVSVTSTALASVLVPVANPAPVGVGRLPIRGPQP